MPHSAPFICVLDTNVVLDLWHFFDPRTQALRALIDAGIARPVTCALVDDELEHVLARSLFVASRTAVLDRWRNVTHPAHITQTAPWRCKDKDDQKFLDLALSTQANVLFTKDKALLALAKKARTHALMIAQPQKWPHLTQVSAQTPPRPL